MDNPIPNPNDGGGVAVADAEGRDAIIFIPGLYHSATAANDDIARRLMRAFDRQAQSGAASFTIEEAKEEDYKGTHKTRVVTIRRKDGDARKPIADFYQLSYDRALTGAYRQRKPIMQALSIGLLLLANSGRLVSAITAKSKTAAEKLQVLYGGFIMIALAAYAVLLLAAVVTTGWDAVQAQRATQSQVVSAQPTSPPAAGQQTQTQTQTERKSRREWLAFVIVFFTAIGLFRQGSLKAFLAETAAHAVPAMDYLDYDRRKGAVIGQFADLLDYLDEKATRYRHIHVISYSFGSIVALDAIFPRLNVQSPRFQKIATLTTIGSPFDFMRTFWPGYFAGRNALPGAPQHWLNIYSPLDVLGSDYRDVKGKREVRGLKLAAGKERGPDSNRLYGRERTLSFKHPFELLALAGFKAHADYWDRTEEYSVGCFDMVVEELYAGDPALA